MKYQELYQEYASLLAEKSAALKILFTLSDGYLSRKKISGKTYYYLQKKVNGKLRSNYVKAKQLPKIKSDLKKRIEIEDNIRIINEQLDKIEAAVKILDSRLYHRLIILRRCSLMDTLSVEMRQKSLSFGNAMTALEGLTESYETKKSLLLWVSGQASYTDGYMKTLNKYHLIEESP